MTFEELKAWGDEVKARTAKTIAECQSTMHEACVIEESRLRLSISETENRQDAGSDDAIVG